MNKKFPPPSGLTWRLPTEAEWEYAAKEQDPQVHFMRPTAAHFTIRIKSMNNILINSGGITKTPAASKPVAQKTPNAWGLYDMHGNIWEWCLDSTSINKNDFGFPRFQLKNPVQFDGNWKLLKGGSFNNDYTRCRFGYRGANAATVSNGDRGLRVCLGPILREEDLNTSLAADSNEEIDKLVKKLSPIPLQPILSGSFMMGSRSLTNFFQKLFVISKRKLLSVEMTLAKSLLKRSDLTNLIGKEISKARYLKSYPYNSKSSFSLGQIMGKFIF